MRRGSQDLTREWQTGGRAGAAWSFSSPMDLTAQRLYEWGRHRQFTSNGLAVYRAGSFEAAALRGRALLR